MFIYIDESGDTGLKIKTGSSLFFVLAMIIFKNEEDKLLSIDLISKIKNKINKPQNFEFHFYKNNTKIRESFLSAIKHLNFNFYVFAINKSSPKVFNEVFNNKDSFYKTVCKLMFEQAMPQIKNAYVVADKTGSRDFHLALAKYIKGITNNKTQKTVVKFKMERSSQNNLIQLADYVAGIYHRSLLNKKDAEYYKSFIKSKEIIFTIWP
jgi:hypothetical protein